MEFQSTHPRRGATLKRFARALGRWVSIHAPQAGCDEDDALDEFYHNCFNPRTPGGVRRYKKERAESQGNMWYVLRTYWCGFPLNKLSDFSFKLSS